MYITHMLTRTLQQYLIDMNVYDMEVFEARRPECE